MENIEFTVKMLAAYMEVSIEKLAEGAEIKAEHLSNVSCGRAKLTADDIVKLSAYTGIPPANIKR